MKSFSITAVIAVASVMLPPVACFLRLAIVKPSFDSLEGLLLLLCQFEIDQLTNFVDVCKR